MSSDICLGREWLRQYWFLYSLSNPVRVTEVISTVGVKVQSLLSWSPQWQRNDHYKQSLKRGRWGWRTKRHRSNKKGGLTASRDKGLRDLAKAMFSQTSEESAKRTGVGTRLPSQASELEETGPANGTATMYRRTKLSAAEGEEYRCTRH